MGALDVFEAVTVSHSDLKPVLDKDFYFCIVLPFKKIQ